MCNDSTGSGPMAPESSAGNSGLIVEPQKKKRKCRRKPKYRNWKFRKDQRYHKTLPSTSVLGNSAPTSGNPRFRNHKLLRSRSLLVPYNTNRFLMDEHLADVPNSLRTPSERSETDFHPSSNAQNDEDFLSKEFSNVYEKARVERLEAMTKQQLIEECLQLEDRYANFNSGNQKLQMQHMQRCAEKIRRLEDQLKIADHEILGMYQYKESLVKFSIVIFDIFAELTRVNKVSHDLQRQDLLSSEDSESDSSSSTSSFSSSSSANSISMLHVGYARHGEVNGNSNHGNYTNGVIQNGYNHRSDEDLNSPRENMVGV